MKKNYKILITWRLLADDISRFKSLFKKNKINYDVIQGQQFVAEKVLKKKINKSIQFPWCFYRQCF